MPFTGVAVVESLGALTARITGVSLKGGAQGVISLAGGAGDVTLPAAFPSSGDNGKALASLVKCDVTMNAQAGPQPATPVRVDKQAAPFELVFTNPDANDTGTLEIYVQYLHSGSR